MFDINAKPSKKGDFTYLDLLHIIYENGGEIDNNVINEMSDVFGVSTTAIKRYIKKMKDAGVIVDNKIADEYVKEIKKVMGSPKFAKKPAKSKDVESLIDPKILKKFPAIRVGSGNSKVRYLFEKILDNMKAQAEKNAVVSLLLTGKPGTGKTSLIRTFSRFTGIPLITIEAPHINEEHIINIPYFVFVGNKKYEGNFTLENKNNDIVLVHAESNLISEIKKIRKKKLTDEEWEKMVTSDKQLEEMFYYLWDDVSYVREKYDVIMFLDEFYRVENERTKNALRDILNGFIGYDKIPKGVYVIYATNLGDGGVSEIPLNHEFKQEEIETPSKEDWFGYILTKYVHNATEESLKYVQLNPDVFNAFYEVLDEEDLSYEDEETGVRVSPRRWEQILLYVNANLPVKSNKDAELLLYNIKMNFTNYETGETAPLYEEKIKPILKKLIKKTSGIDVNREAKPYEWMDALRQQVETKMKLGDYRQYVPALSGKHGIGKTTFIRSIADEYNMILVSVNVSNLTRDQVTGIPIMDKTGEIGPDGNPIVKTKFEKPTLLQIIEKRIQEAIEERKAAGLPMPDGKYKYLIFFDELSRTTDDVFNAIRRVLLEGKFNHEHSLPEGSMVVAAFNPVDVGANTLTAHTRDVLDILNAEPDWNRVIEYIRESGDGIVHEMNVEVFERFVEEKSASVDIEGNEIDAEMQKFYFGIHGLFGIYVSPRLLADIIAEIDAAVESLLETGIFKRFDKDIPGARVNLKKINNYILGIDDEEFREALIDYRKNKIADEEIEKILGIYDPALSYNPEEKSMFIIAMVMTFVEKMLSGVRFEVMKRTDSTSKNDPDVVEFDNDTYNLLVSSPVKSLISYLNEFVEVATNGNKDKIAEVREKIQTVIEENAILAIYNKLFEKNSGISDLVDLRSLFEYFSNVDENSDISELFSPTLFSFFDDQVDLTKINNEVSDILREYANSEELENELRKEFGEITEEFLSDPEFAYKMVEFSKKNIQFNYNLIQSEKEITGEIEVSEKELIERLKKAGITDEYILKNAYKFREIAIRFIKFFGDKYNKVLTAPLLFLLSIVKYILNRVIDENGNIVSKNNFGSLVNVVLEIVNKDLKYSRFISDYLSKNVVYENPDENEFSTISIATLGKVAINNNPMLFSYYQKAQIHSRYLYLIKCLMNGLTDADNLNNEFVKLFRNLSGSSVGEVMEKILNKFEQVMKKLDVCAVSLSSDEIDEKLRAEFGFDENCSDKLRKWYCDHIATAKEKIAKFKKMMKDKEE